MPNQDQPNASSRRLAEALARLAMNQRAEQAAALNTALVQNPALARQLSQTRQTPVTPVAPQLSALPLHPNAVTTPEELDAQPEQKVPTSEEMNQEIDDLIKGIDRIDPFGTPRPKPPAPPDRDQPIHPNGRQVFMQQNGMPLTGVDPELWKYLTDEERALWKTS